MRDSYADIAALAEIDLDAEPDAYTKAMRAAYWEDKDLSGAMAIAWAGISRLLAQAHGATPEQAYGLRSEAKALSYDLASFTWAGWDEPGIVITPPEARAGCAAARVPISALWPVTWASHWDAAPISPPFAERRAGSFPWNRPSPWSN